MAEDLAKAIVRASSMMEQKEKTLPISVLYRSIDPAVAKNYYLCSGSKSTDNKQNNLGSCPASAYNQVLEKGFIPMEDMEHPAAQMMSRAFVDEPYQTLVGIFVEPLESTHSEHT